MRLTGPTLLPPRCSTMNEALRLASQTAEGLTLVDAREQETFISFSELYARARRVAAGLLGRGVMPHDRVALDWDSRGEHREGNCDGRAAQGEEYDGALQLGSGAAA